MAVLDMEILKHTGENIGNKIEESINSFGFLKSKCVAIVRDDARNMQAAANTIGLPRFLVLFPILFSKIWYKFQLSFQCCAHFLHLCIEKALKTDFIQQLVEKVLEWVKFCRTTIGKATLNRHQKQQNVAEKQLILVF